MENFLDKLTEEQSEIALEIVKKAKEMGIDPRLAVALAYRESGLNPKAKGSSGEVGLMQVMPATAKGMGFTPDELADPSKNIEIGLTYLKRGLEKFGGDPVLAAAGYNAGLDHPYFTDPENKPLPASTKEYLKGISGLGGFTASTPKEEDAPQQVEAPASESDFQANKARIAADLTAAGIGAGIAKGVDVAKNIGDTGAAIRQLPAVLSSQAPAAAPTAPAAPGMARPVAGGPAGPVGGPASPLSQMGGVVPTDEMHTRQLQGTTEQGATGRARQNTYNEMTAQQAARRKAQEGVLSSLRQQNVIGQSADDLLAKLPGMTATPSGILAPSSAVYPTAPSAPPVPPQAPPQPGPLSRAAGAVKQGAGAVLRSPLVMGALGGVSAMEGAQETQKRFSEGDMPGAAIASAGVVGGGLQMVPSVPTKAFGAMISAASPLTLYLYDKLRGQGAQEPQEPTERELMEASRPAFGIYPKPMRQPPLQPRTFAPGENMPPVEFLR